MCRSSSNIILFCIFLTFLLNQDVSGFIVQQPPSKNWGLSQFSLKTNTIGGKPSDLVVVDSSSRSSGVTSRKTVTIGNWRSTCRKMVATDETSSLDGIKIIIAGAPASGKGTQCEMIKEKFGIVHLSTGDMLRAAVAAKTSVGTLAKEYMDAGKLVPDEVIIGVVKDRLEEADCQEKGWLLDGFPRTRAQADALAEAGVCADCFLFLNVPDSVLVERVVGRRTDPETGKIYHMTFSPPEDEDVLARLVQRSDDTEEKVKVRLEQFHANVAAVQGCYTDISVEINGTGKPSDVAKLIESAIEEKCLGKAA